MSLSVIVLTSPGREDNLRACLSALSQQNRLAEKIHIVDDGSQRGAAIVKAFQTELPLSYDWRPHDYCMSRSYNRAVKALSSERLVFLSGDILLNPQALSFYHEYYQALPPSAIWGYFGSHKPESVTSQLIPGRQVNIRDIRLWFTPEEKLTCPPEMFQHPQIYAWGGNWALSRSLFTAAGGFDERFSGWGYEDVAFANRLIAQGVPQAFAIDVWGEHQVHPEGEDSAVAKKNRERIGPLAPSRHEPGLLFHPGRTDLPQRLIKDYGVVAQVSGRGTEGGQ
ncbi:hypothetical protein COW36_24665 [bacterium (Candidatus Blackallbacteria) CG17_big_fil_post_rev_8_21_14_2_50_48_46]|uniref:Glycosyltransferase n=1 Tax=bacterium (Candidatus Blackallbacteria) CG17_big_fil_post_rev_8_21_14_2_50_48_46 TaxID=2014261 RepID=A0A2M7FXP6_9BACT|nr:MAG: hypothetical protein COW64_19605 [bacterium (Candidatus Blackallbacteria) CG18_big_fil_WC_8_21_14_2_50_49_26]PIW13862.1 MAG: hypothetical protein COW36_24665 [bacterium (Candidatus Blackallbacteria) CG17_big_fil_post_rev_8_21_14_2_50_48_46]PIW45088.1 MAG: hypothetical protein COW20_22295 [bacterium (Candidatus Blackallbacteria) CG13_big_fil_rev_8_21_14_2_50_49_14]